MDGSTLLCSKFLVVDWIVTKTGVCSAMAVMVCLPVVWFDKRQAGCGSVMGIFLNCQGADPKLEPLQYEFHHMWHKIDGKLSKQCQLRVIVYVRGMGEGVIMVTNFAFATLSWVKLIPHNAFLRKP